MHKILTNNYLLFVDLLLRILLAIVLPKVFSPVMLAKYNYILVVFFWFMILDFGTSQGFSLRVIRKYNPGSVNFAYLLTSFLFSFILTCLILVIYFSFSNEALAINFLAFFLTYLALLVYSFLTTIFRGLGLFNIDFLGKIIVSLSLIIIISFNSNLESYFYILLPYFLGAVYLLYAFNSKITFFFRKTKSLLFTGLHNMKSGIYLYLTNSLLIIFPLMDKVVFSKVILIENYGNYLFSYSLSSLHVLVQSQITNKYYRFLLSEKISEKNKKVTLLLISLLIHIVLSIFILNIINLNIFKTFYSNYKYVNQYIITTELLCISISILSILYLIINSSKVVFSFFILSYSVPLITFIMYKLYLIDDIYYWIFVYIIELLIVISFLIKSKFILFTKIKI